MLDEIEEFPSGQGHCATLPRALSMRWICMSLRMSSVLRNEIWVMMKLNLLLPGTLRALPAALIYGSSEWISSSSGHFNRFAG
jgi:hypothetical protein